MAEKQGYSYYTKEEINEKLVSYSTTEEAVGKWIDGSTIYRKTIEFGALPDTNVKLSEVRIENFNSFVKIDGYAIDSTGKYILHLPYASPNALTENIALYTTVTSNIMRIGIRTGSNRSSFTGYVTIYYTKVES